MEFTRRRKRRGRIVPRDARKNGSSGGKVLLALVLAGVVIYFISASAVGTWIAKNWLAPAFSYIDTFLKNITEEKPAVNKEHQQEPSMQSETEPLGQPSSAAFAEEIIFPGMTCYALQMGVYTERENANLQAEQLQMRGAGGYVLEDAGRYRVLAAAYTEKESLTAVREQLKAENMESAAYVFSTNDTAMRVNASREQLDGIKEAIQALYTLQQKMAEETLRFDKQQLTPQQGKEIAKELLNTLQTAQDRFFSLGEQEDPVMRAIFECFKTCTSVLENLNNANSETTVDFSSKMKYTHLNIVDAYSSLSHAISTG